MKSGNKVSGGGLGPRAGVSYSSRSKTYTGSQTGRGKVSRGAIARGDVDRGGKSRSHDRHDKQAWNHDKWNHDNKNWRHHRRHGYFASNIYIYSGDYDANCAWLRRQALATGSPYWWSRYNACISIY